MAPSTFVVPPAARVALIEHARREQPNECCGLLVGRPGLVMAVVPMRNVLRSQTRYRIDDREHIALLRTVRRFAPLLEIVGVYHSHPNSAPIPSPTDVAEAHYPDWVYVIIGLARARAEIRAFRIGHGRSRRVRTRQTPTP